MFGTMEDFENLLAAIHDKGKLSGREVGREVGVEKSVLQMLT